ncbi:putative molluscan insulin-related peptide(s) receptor isoform X2 [Lineus longissimus]|uniref:putative molluscan insulin-related peptide(s) receptor isoform X2 n=1 Tax=Lineus longissimus TaxID=88925 RepID=UPI00315C9672
MTMLDVVGTSELGVFLLSGGALLGLIVSLLACACCYKKNFGFKEFNDSNSITDSEHHDSDFNVFSPHDTTRQTSRESIKFDPLPDPSALPADNVATLRPRIAPLNKERLGTEALLESFNYEFSRTQLQFIREIGTGWFGKVLQGEAQKITVGLRKSKVVVKVLDMEASGQDKIDFLLDNSPYRELDHANVVRLLGQSTQDMPFLMIMEYFTLGDVKTYLLKRQNEANNFSERRILVKLACDMAAGLHCLHYHHFVHNDFALRNCMVAMDMSVKVGDYGISEDLYKDDYYGPVEYLVPIRWSAPETAQVIGDQVLIHNMTKEANVWSFGVTLWELVSLGGQPYPGMTDQDVIKNVLVERNTKPSVPVTKIKDKERMYEIMQLCMGEPSQRPTMAEAHKLLQHLQESPFELDEFDEKWNKLLPKSDSATEKIHSHGSPHFPMNFDDNNIHDSDDIEKATLGPSRLSFTQGFEIDSKTGFKAEEESSNKVIVNPSFEDGEDDIDQFIDEMSTPVATQEVGNYNLSPELDREVTKVERSGIGSDFGEGFDTTVLPISDFDMRQKSDSLRNSVHMLVSKSPSEDHVEIDILDKSDFETSRAESFMTAGSSPIKSDSYSAGDFETPVGSIDMNDTESGLREIERSEDQVIMPGRCRVSSSSESEHDVTATLRRRESVDSEHSSGSAAERITQLLSEIAPPPYSPSKSPGAEDDGDDQFDFDNSLTVDYNAEEDETDITEVVVRRKHGTVSDPSQRSGLVEPDEEMPESGFMHLKDIDANAHVHNKDTEDLLDEVGEENGMGGEQLLTGSDGRTYRRKSLIKPPDQLSLSTSGNHKRVSFTETENLVQVHTYPKEGSGSDMDGNRNAVIIDFDKSSKPDDEALTGEDLTDTKPNDLDDDMAMLIM